jgi:hypothetical protein
MALALATVSSWHKEFSFSQWGADVAPVTALLAAFDQ